MLVLIACFLQNWFFEKFLVFGILYLSFDLSWWLSVIQLLVCLAFLFLVLFLVFTCCQDLFFYTGSILAMKIDARIAYLFLFSVGWIHSFGPGSLLCLWLLKPASAFVHESHMSSSFVILVTSPSGHFFQQLLYILLKNKQWKRSLPCIFCCWENVGNGASKSDLKSELECPVGMEIMAILVLLY